MQASPISRARWRRAWLGLGMVVGGLLLAVVLSTCGNILSEDSTGPTGLVWDQGNWDATNWQ